MSAQLSVSIGWIGIFLGFFTGMILGLGTVNDAWLGGYSARSRRYVRLGHIALSALGMMNVLAGLTIRSGFEIGWLSQLLLIVGLIAMPSVCFLTAWRPKNFFLFPIPVVALLGAASVIILGVVK